MKLLTNTTLLAIFLAILFIPITVMHFAVANRSVSGIVAGARIIDAKTINILPNVKDFHNYVSFRPGDLTNGIYTDTLTVTAFSRQKATYRGVYSLYNLTDDESFDLEIATPGMSVNERGFDRLLLYIGNADQNTLLNDVQVGATLVPVAETMLFSDGEMVLIGDEPVKVVMVTREALVVTPLTKDHAQGERVLAQAIVAYPGGLTSPVTQTVRIQPGSNLLVTVEVQGAAGSLEKDQKVSIPLEFRFRR